jgi:hypothetical protein
MDMARNKKPSGNRTDIKIGDIRDVSGTVQVAGGDIHTFQSNTELSIAEMGRLFDQVYVKIDTYPMTSPATKEDIKAEVQEIQEKATEAAKGNRKMDEGMLSRKFRSITRMAPDILDVVVATLANPLAGLGIAAKKIAEKAKEKTTDSK